MAEGDHVTTITGVQKNGVAALAADTFISTDSIGIPSGFRRNQSKIVTVDGSYLAMAGALAHELVMKSLIRSRPDDFDLSSTDSIFETFRKLHPILVEDYFLKTDDEEDSQEYESNQLHILLANSAGVFELQDYREVIQYDRFWAIGSGRNIALGAMEALYESDSLSALEITEQGVRVACRFDLHSDLPLESYEVSLKKI